MKTLVVGDAHVDEHQDLERFTALGKFLRATKPDNLVLIGDFLSLNCLSAWDRDKRQKMEGARYRAELEAGNEALDRIGKLPSCTNRIFVEGNHEDRLTRYLAIDPVFHGVVDVEQDLDLRARGFSWVPYKSDIVLGGVSFTHCPINGVGRAISNPNVAQKALRLYSNSVVFGHTHTLDHAAEHRHGSPHLQQALSVGCFFEHVDEYAKGSITNYWRGLVMLDQYSENRFDITTLSMSRLLKEYK